MALAGRQMVAVVLGGTVTLRVRKSFSIFHSLAMRQRIDS
jgi:hypothetical protein